MLPRLLKLKDKFRMAALQTLECQAL
jgi:hypothetical protein